MEVCFGIYGGYQGWVVPFAWFFVRILTLQAYLHIPPRRDTQHMNIQNFGPTKLIPEDGIIDHFINFWYQT